MQHADQDFPVEDERSPLNDQSLAGEPAERHSPDPEGENRSMDPEDMTLADVIDAESGRPDLPDETSDGLDDMDEEIRHQAEDRPLDRSGRE